MQGEPLSTTSQRTFLARQQQHALDARRFTGRELPARPATEAFRLACWLSAGVTAFGMVVVATSIGR